VNALPHLRDQSPPPAKPDRLSLRCPRCASALGAVSQTIAPFATAITCAHCSFALDHQRGIWLALAPERQEYYKRFLTEYQIVRAAEGRGSVDADYYLALPFRDISGKNQAQWSIRAQTYRYIERELLPEIDPNRVGLDVLDLGAGNGWLSYRLSLLGHRPVAVDLLTNDSDGLGAATHYLQKLERLFPRFQADLDCLPFEDAQFDCVIFNASFHYSENYSKTLAEAIRCLRSDGVVIIADTPWYSKEESGRHMLRERRAFFQQQFGFPSDALASREYLTDRRLRELEKFFGIRWQIHHPSYGLRWAMRPVLAKLNGKREPSSFRIYLARLVRT
jgi:SAM-dependent methyltransferase